jgi:dienelactone hydrolase
MTCENVTIKGDKGTPITAYAARPSGAGPFPGVVLIHHLPGWSEFYIETTRRFAHHGYLAICANLYEREGGGSEPVYRTVTNKGQHRLSCEPNAVTILLRRGYDAAGNGRRCDIEP